MMARSAMLSVMGGGSGFPAAIIEAESLSHKKNISILSQNFRRSYGRRRRFLHQLRMGSV
jgi:hypothetical protein